MNRYVRQVCLPEVGQQGQELLYAATVLVVGAGGLGSTVLPLLAGAGIGRLRIVDPDRVEESNLHRQVLYRMADIGHPKVEAAAKALAALNPDCRIDPLAVRLDPARARTEIFHADVVVDAADSFTVTYALSDLCHEMRKPLISASVLGRTGYVGGFCGTAPSYRSVFPDLPVALQSCASGGVMGPVVATLGAMQAQMVLSALLKHNPSPMGQLMSVDMQSWRLSSFRFDTAGEPETPVPRVLAREEITSRDIVIELRDACEAPELPLRQAQRITADALAGFVPEAGRRVVFSCATGQRAWRAATDLARRADNTVAILALSE
jgi:molybdopterin/thiamine biosynthesis adenylyltransferase